MRVWMRPGGKPAPFAKSAKGAARARPRVADPRREKLDGANVSATSKLLCSARKMPVKLPRERTPALCPVGESNSGLRPNTSTSALSGSPHVLLRWGAPSGNIEGLYAYQIGAGAGDTGKPEVKPANFMKAWQKFAVAAGAAAVLGGGIWVAVWQINNGVVTVQTAPATRQDLVSIVTASGEVKPLTYTNVLGEGMGKITSIEVKEGDHVKKGDVLLRLESVQPAADVEAQRAGIAAAEAGVKSAEANDLSTQADIKSRAAY